MSGGKKGGQTIGYSYIMTLLCGLWRGPINELLAIRADDKIAWRGHVQDATPTAVNAPELFGGEKKEGGIQGGFELLQGARTQVLPGAVFLTVASPILDFFGAGGPVPSVTIPNIKTSIGGRVSELRGFASLLFRGMVCAMNPYPKEWHFLGWRTTNGWFGGTSWYPAKATIYIGTAGAITAMNPAHIIYQTLTDPEWGANRSAAELDENSFILAANTLCAEGFGLCLNWARQEDVDTFLQTVIDHIAGVLYTDPATGKLVLKLIRADYDPATVPLYDANSGLLDIEDDDSASSDEAINEVIVKGKDQTVAGAGDDFEVRAHNVAARQAEGAVSQTIEYPGIATRDLAQRVAQRELRVHASGLKRLRLKLDRRAWRVVPGSVIAISSPKHNISNMILRVGDVQTGNTADGKIDVRAVEDVFGMPENAFQTPTEGSWTPPGHGPASPASRTRLIEAGYRDMLVRAGATNMADVQPTDAWIGQMAAAPDGYAYRYDLASKTSGETDYVVRSTGTFTGYAILAADAGPLDTGLTVSGGVDFDTSQVGQALLIGDEVVRLDTWAGTSITVARGCADTVPQIHPAGTVVWTLDDDLASDARQYVSSEIVDTKVLTRTTTDVLALSDASVDTVTLVSRHYKPYPPGNVKIDGVAVYVLSGIHATPVLTFADRDRLTEDDQLIEFGASSVGPEAGTTYTVRVKSADGTTLLRTATVTSGWTYDGTMQAADGSPAVVLMELESVRGGIVSWQMHSFTVILVDPAASPLVSIDFKTGTYAIGGVSKTLGDVVEENTAYGTFNTANVVAGVGLKMTETGDAASFPVLTAAAYAAAIPTGVDDGFTAVLTLSITTTDNGSAYVGTEMITDLSSGWGAEVGFDSTGNVSVLYDYDAIDDTLLEAIGSAHKMAMTVSADHLAASIDGATVTATGAPQANPATVIGIFAIAFTTGTGTATAILERIDYYATATDAVLPTLSTP